jgi:hypothetical protein
MHFNQARQGKGPLRPRTVRPAFLLIGAGIAYSQCFYAPEPRELKKGDKKQ